MKHDEKCEAGSPFPIHPCRCNERRLAKRVNELRSALLMLPGSLQTPWIWITKVRGEGFVRELHVVIGEPENIDV